MTDERTLRWRIRLLTWFFIFGLIVSGVTAIPLRQEVDGIIRLWGAEELGSQSATDVDPITLWLFRVRDALPEPESQNGILYYGTDWLAFGHFAIAIAFVGALRDPVRNRWLFDFGMIACALVVPFAFIFGGIRGIPIWWRLIDCSFGGVGFVPLWFCRKWSLEIERLPVA